MASESKTQPTQVAVRRRILCLSSSVFLVEFLKHTVNLQVYDVENAENVSDGIKIFGKITDWSVVLCAIENETDIFALLKHTREFPQLFVIVYSLSVNAHCKRRLETFAAGASMLANDTGAIQTVLRQISSQWSTEGPYECPVCHYSGLTEVALHLHDPLYHSSRGLAATHPCPICLQSSFPHAHNVYAVHLHNEHGPIDLREPSFPKFSAFSLVVCRRKKDGKFLMVHEPAPIAKGLPNFWLPAGRVDAGESFVQAAMRETEEEGGIKVRILGVLNFSLSEYVPRVTFLAEPLDDEEVPRSIPNWESVGAMWVDAKDLNLLTKEDYRASDPAYYFPKVASGEMKAASLSTEPFSKLETLMQQITIETLEKREDYSKRFGSRIITVWESLMKVYPTICKFR